MIFQQYYYFFDDLKCVMGAKQISLWTKYAIILRVMKFMKVAN